MSDDNKDQPIHKEDGVYTPKFSTGGCTTNDNGKGDSMNGSGKKSEK